jgi:hypothetical protein
VKRVLVWAGVLALAAVGVVAAWVVVPSALDLAAARRALPTSPQGLDAGEIRAARGRLERAAGRLGSPPGRVLGAVPALGPNVSALRVIASETIPVLDAALALEERSDALAGSLVDDGAVDFSALASMQAPVDRETEALRDLEDALASHRSGWLLPPLWSRMDEYLRRVAGLRDSAETAARVLEIAPAMLGEGGSRTYLVALLNNTELRGGGGILSGVGTITATDGRLETGEFTHYKQLAEEPPYRRVPAPADYHRHFGVYDADTTRWLAASSSPDIPDVALVARRLFELTAGVEADGVIFADPRGIAALMPPGARVEVPAADVELTRSEVPEFIYTRAYETLGGATEARREGIIDVGHDAFEDALRKGLRSSATLARAADAIAGEHLRVVSFDASEAAVLEEAGVTGELGSPARDGALVTVQNYGGNKLDFYAHRRVGHRCEVDADGSALCSTETVIRNRTPLGLTDYQYQYEPLGLFKNFVEIYVPERAELTAVEVDGDRARFYPAREDGYRAVGVYLRIPRNTETRVSVGYTLPPGDGYSLSLMPQPLTHDADVVVNLDVPEGWVLEGPDLSVSRGTMTFEGELDRALVFEAGPNDRTGIPALWATLERFWNEPLF